MLFLNIPEDKIPANKFPELKDYLQYLNEVRQNPIQITVCVEDDIIRGIMLYGEQYIDHVYVEPSSRRAGIGTKLAKLVINADEFSPTVAYVPTNNTVGVCFFSALGGIITHRRIDVESEKHRFVIEPSKRTLKLPPLNMKPSNIAGWLDDFIISTPIYLMHGDKMG